MKIGRIYFPDTARMCESEVRIRIPSGSVSQDGRGSGDGGSRAAQEAGTGGVRGPPEGREAFGQGSRLLPTGEKTPQTTN